MVITIAVGVERVVHGEISCHVIDRSEWIDLESGYVWMLVQ